MPSKYISILHTISDNNFLISRDIVFGRRSYQCQCRIGRAHDRGRGETPLEWRRNRLFSLEMAECYIQHLNFEDSNGDEKYYNEDNKRSKIWLQPTDDLTLRISWRITLFLPYYSENKFKLNNDKLRDLWDTLIIIFVGSSMGKPH